MGRPTDYTPEIGAQICELLGDGLSLKDICGREDMPARSTIYLWLARNTEFSDMYARAREEQADTLADEIIGIADDNSRDVHEDGEGNEVVNHDVINRARLRVDARKWVAAKLKPKKYGEKTTSDVNVTGKLEVAWVTGQQGS